MNELGDEINNEWVNVKYTNELLNKAIVKVNELDDKINNEWVDVKYINELFNNAILKGKNRNKFIKELKYLILNSV